MLAREKRRLLREPRWSFCCEDLNDRAALRAAAQLSQRIEHRTVGFLASIPFDALPTHDTDGPLAHRNLTLEFFSQRGLADSRFAGDEHDLPHATEGEMPGLAQQLEHAVASHQRASCRRAGYRSTRSSGFGHRSDEPVSALGDCLDKKRILWAVPERGAHLENVLPHRLRLDHPARPRGFEKLIGSHQAPSVLDQIYKDRIGLGCHQDAFLLPCIAASPETLVHDIEPERGEHLHRMPAAPARVKVDSEPKRNSERTTVSSNAARLCHP